METITELELRELAQTEQPNCVSIHMPTHRKGHETKEAPLRLKGLLNQAEQLLTLDRCWIPPWGCFPTASFGVIKVMACRCLSRPPELHSIVCPAAATKSVASVVMRFTNN